MNKLPNVTVRTERKAIVEDGDTTTYAVGRFKEYEDERIEEILRKIPGVEVKENGSISVKGKPLHRILIEGSDLFGKDYQLASKNIRAKDIGTIEEIDHYQENVVLKTVNKSEAIVLNLKLKDEAKSVLSGSIIPGIGYGEELKYHEYASIFKVSRKHKTIFIGNLDNVASGFGDSSLGATYNSSKAFDLRRDANEPWRLINNNSVDHLGLKPVYTDNARTLFTTIRHETNLSPRWTMNVNGVYGSNNRNQTQRTEQSYLIDPERFGFREVNDWSNSSRYFKPEIEFSYVGAAQKTSLELFASTSGEDFSQLETRLLNDVRTSEDREDTHRNTSVRALLSRQFKPGLVGLLEFSTGSLAEILNASLSNSPIPSVLGLDKVRPGTYFHLQPV